MKKEFLEGLKLDSGVIEQILKESEKERAEGDKAHKEELSKFADYEDLKKQLETANATLDKFKDYDQTKAEVEKYKAEIDKLSKDSAARIAGLERENRVTDFLSGKKFVNKITAQAVRKQLADMLADTSNAGKNLEELFSTMVKDDDNILLKENAPTPPVVPQMKTGSNPPNDSADDAKIDAIMGISRK